MSEDPNATAFEESQSVLEPLLPPCSSSIDNWINSIKDSCIICTPAVPDENDGDYSVEALMDLASRAELLPLLDLSQLSLLSTTKPIFLRQLPSDDTRPPSDREPTQACQHNGDVPHLPDDVNGSGWNLMPPALAPAPAAAMAIGAQLLSGSNMHSANLEPAATPPPIAPPVSPRQEDAQPAALPSPAQSPWPVYGSSRYNASEAARMALPSYTTLVPCGHQPPCSLRTSNSFHPLLPELWHPHIAQRVRPRYPMLLDDLAHDLIRHVHDPLWGANEPNRNYNGARPFDGQPRLEYAVHGSAVRDAYGSWSEGPFGSSTP